MTYKHTMPKMFAPWATIKAGKRLGLSQYNRPCAQNKNAQFRGIANDVNPLDSPSLYKNIIISSEVAH